jgi:hypothetical protein
MAIYIQAMKTVKAFGAVALAVTNPSHEASKLGLVFDRLEQFLKDLSY